MTNTSNASKSSRKMFEDEQIREIKAALESAPAPVRKLTAKETIEALSSELQEACVRGHNAGSLAAVLVANGLSTNERAVARVMRSNAPRASKKNVKLSALPTT